MREREKIGSPTDRISVLADNPTLQLDTATMLDIVCRPGGRSPAKTGLAGWADIVTLTSLTQGSAVTTSFALCSNCQDIKLQDFCTARYITWSQQPSRIRK